MKYVRTRDGIFEPITDINSKSYNFKAKFHGSYVIVSKSTIIKTGDTIEELCDCFIYEYFHFETKTVRRKMFDKTSEFSNYEIDFKNGLEKVYGAIFTEHGISYVAKMNDKRELKLLCD